MEDPIDYEHRLTAVEGRSERNEGRIKELEQRQDNLDKLATSVSLLAEREERMESDVKEIKTDVKALTGKSGKLWDSMVEKIVLTAAAAIVGYILAKLGFGA